MVRTRRRQSRFIDQNHLASDSMDGHAFFCKLQPILPDNLTRNIWQFYWKPKDTAKTRDNRIWEAVLFAIGQLVWVYSHEVERILDELKDVWAEFMIDGYWAKAKCMTYGELSDYIKKAQKKIHEVVTPPEDEVVTSQDEVVTPQDGGVTFYETLSKTVETQKVPLHIFQVMAGWCPGGEIKIREFVKMSMNGVHRVVIKFGIRDHDRVFYAYDDGHYEVHKSEYAGGFSVTMTQMCSIKPGVFHLEESWKEWYVKRNPHTTIKFNKSY